MFELMTLFVFPYQLWLFFLCISYVKRLENLQAPPPSVLPLDSISLNGAVQTQFVNSSSADPTYEVCQEISCDPVCLMHLT